jgi:hypothetical protein
MEEVVRPERFELPACCSGGNRSIQLSYGRVLVVYTGEGMGFNAIDVGSSDVWLTRKAG